MYNCGYELPETTHILLLIRILYTFFKFNSILYKCKIVVTHTLGI